MPHTSDALRAFVRLPNLSRNLANPVDGRGPVQLRLGVTRLAWRKSWAARSGQQRHKAVVGRACHAREMTASGGRLGRKLFLSRIINTLCGLCHAHLHNPDSSRRCKEGHARAWVNERGRAGVKTSLTNLGFVNSCDFFAPDLLRTGRPGAAAMWDQSDATGRSRRERSEGET